MLVKPAPPSLALCQPHRSLVLCSPGHTGQRPVPNILFCGIGPVGHGVCRDNSSPGLPAPWMWAGTVEMASCHGNEVPFKRTHPKHAGHSGSPPFLSCCRTVAENLSHERDHKKVGLKVGMGARCPGADLQLGLPSFTGAWNDWV